MSELGLTSEKIKTVDTLKIREGVEPCAGSRLLVLPLLFGEDTKQHRSSAMRAAYLAMDRADPGNSVKNLASPMQRPKEVDMQPLKRLGRYFKGEPRVVERSETPLSRDGQS